MCLLYQARGGGGCMPTPQREKRGEKGEVGGEWLLLREIFITVFLTSLIHVASRASVGSDTLHAHRRPSTLPVATPAPSNLLP